jgi:ribonuclease P protein component
LWCSFVNDPAATPLRVAFSVGRSVGSATRRNRLRRRLRVIVAAAAPRVGMDGGWLLIGATPGAIELTFEQLCGEVDLLVERIAPAAVSGR